MTIVLNCKLNIMKELNISNKIHSQPQGLPKSLGQALPRVPSSPAPWLAARPGAPSSPQAQVSRRPAPPPITRRALIGRLQRRGAAGTGGRRAPPEAGRGEAGAVGHVAAARPRGSRAPVAPTAAWAPVSVGGRVQSVPAGAASGGPLTWRSLRASPGSPAPRALQAVQVRGARNAWRWVGAVVSGAVGGGLSLTRVRVAALC